MEKSSAEEDVVAEFGDADLAPARRDATGVEEQGGRRNLLPHAIASDRSDRDGALPCAAVARRGRHVAMVDEGKLARLADDAADRIGKTTRGGAVDDRLRDGELAVQRLALRLIIDRGSKAIALFVACRRGGTVGNEIVERLRQLRGRVGGAGLAGRGTVGRARR